MSLDWSKPIRTAVTKTPITVVRDYREHVSHIALKSVDVPDDENGRLYRLDGTPRFDGPALENYEPEKKPVLDWYKPKRTVIGHLRAKCVTRSGPTSYRVKIDEIGTYFYKEDGTAVYIAPPLENYEPEEKILVDWTKPIQTRDGRPARVLCTDLKGAVPVVVAIDGYTSECVSYRTREGFISNSGQYGGDIINVPEKPLEKEVYINLYRGVNIPAFVGSANFSRSRADYEADDKIATRTACVKVKLVEGQFDT